MDDDVDVDEGRTVKMSEMSLEDLRRENERLKEELARCDEVASSLNVRLAQFAEFLGYRSPVPTVWTKDAGEMLDVAIGRWKHGSYDWEGLMTEADRVAVAKGRDYTKGSSDRLANFKNSGADAGITPLQAWLVFYGKHHAAICSYIKTNGQSESEPIFGRFVDALNYLRLGWLLAKENEDAKKEAAKLNYVMGAGRYQEKPGFSLVEGGSGRKFELHGRGATSATVVYDGFTEQHGWAVAVSEIGKALQDGQIFPIDGTPP